MKKTTKLGLMLSRETIRNLTGSALGAVRGGFITDTDGGTQTDLCMSSEQRTRCTSGNCSDVCTGSTKCTQTCGANSNCGCTWD
jgi:hypothetical protein